MNKIKQQISETLDTLWFYIGNPDWEFSEKAFDRVVEEIYDSIDTKVDPVERFTEEYVRKFYPYHI